MLRHCLFTILLLSWCGAAGAFAQNATPPAPAAPSYPNVRVGATLFTDYTYTVKPQVRDADGVPYSPNAFTVGRSYINVTGSLSPVIAFRFTPDIAEEADSESSLEDGLTFRVKYAYLQANLDKWLGAGTWMRFGMQPTTFVVFSEHAYRYRFQGTIMVERERYLSSSDAGASYRYVIPKGFGDVHAGVYNGETFREFEANDQKAIEIRATVRPFPNGQPLVQGLRVTGFMHSDFYSRDAERHRLIGSVTYEHQYLNAGFDYLDTLDQETTRVAPVNGSGYSIWATPRTKWRWEGLLRYDHLKPDETREEIKTRTIYGVAYWPRLPGASQTAFLVDVERVTYTEAIPALPNEQRIALHVLLRF